MNRGGELGSAPGGWWTRRHGRGEEGVRARHRVRGRPRRWWNGRKGPGEAAIRGRGCLGRRPDADRGSATVWSLGAIAVLCVVFGAVLALGQAVVVRHRAAGGADLAALAAADHWSEGGAAACTRAERLAAAQGVRLVRCAIVGDTSDVTAAAGRGPFAAEVRARAGPPGPVAPAAPDGAGSVPPAVAPGRAGNALPAAPGAPDAPLPPAAPDSAGAVSVAAPDGADALVPGRAGRWRGR